MLRCCVPLSLERPVPRKTAPPPAAGRAVRPGSEAWPGRQAGHHQVVAPTLDRPPRRRARWSSAQVGSTGGLPETQVPLWAVHITSIKCRARRRGWRPRPRARHCDRQSGRDPTTVGRRSCGRAGDVARGASRLTAGRAWAADRPARATTRGVSRERSARQRPKHRGHNPRSAARDPQPARRQITVQVSPSPRANDSR